MTATLQITIPTYNRPEKIKNLIRVFSEISDLCYSNRIVISIFDNSDFDIAQINKQSLPNYFQYIWNETNVGFVGNVKKCLSSGLGFYTWVISDDDTINAQEVKKLLDFLDELDPSVEGVALPCEIKSFVGENTSLAIGLAPEFGKLLSFKDAITPTKLPFDYLASFIIKTSILSRVRLSEMNEKNDYIHSLIYCNCLQAADLIFVYHKGIISYESSKKLNWSLPSLINSKIEIFQVLQRKTGLPMNQTAVVTEVLKWAIFSRVGMCHIESLENDRLKLLTIAIKNISIKNFFLGMLLILPKFMANEIAIFALALFGKSNSDLKLSEKLKKNLSNIRLQLSK